MRFVKIGLDFPLTDHKNLSVSLRGKFPPLRIWSRSDGHEEGESSFE